MSTFGRVQNGLSGGSGSSPKTSSAAPPIVRVLQRVDERRLVDELSAADVDEHRVGPHQRELGAADEPARLAACAAPR